MGYREAGRVQVKWAFSRSFRQCWGWGGSRNYSLYKGMCSLNVEVKVELKTKSQESPHHPIPVKDLRAISVYHNGSF